MLLANGQNFVRVWLRSSPSGVGKVACARDKTVGKPSRHFLLRRKMAVAPERAPLTEPRSTGSPAVSLCHTRSVWRGWLNVQSGLRDAGFGWWQLPLLPVTAQLRFEAKSAAFLKSGAWREKRLARERGHTALLVWGTRVTMTKRTTAQFREELRGGQSPLARRRLHES